MLACLDQWRQSTLGCDDTGLQEQIRDIETVSRTLHAVILDAVAELEFRNLAATTGFGSTTLRLRHTYRMTSDAFEL